MPGVLLRRGSRFASVVLAQQEKALRVQAVRDASDSRLLVDDDPPAAHVARCLGKRAQHRIHGHFCRRLSSARRLLRASAVSSVSRSYVAACRDPQRGRGSGEFSRERRLIHVYADAGDEHTVVQLNQNAGAFSAVEKNVVRPSEVGRHTANIRDRLRRCEPQRQRDERQSCPGRSSAEAPRTCTARRLRSECQCPSETALSGCLFIGDDNRADRDIPLRRVRPPCASSRAGKRNDESRAWRLEKVDSEVEIYGLRLVRDRAA